MYLPTLHSKFFNEALNDFFQPTFTRKLSIDHKVLADKTNYSIWELPNGMYEVRVQVVDHSNQYYRSTTRKTLEEAEDYVEEQTTYHKKHATGPVMVKSYKKD